MFDVPPDANLQLTRVEQGLSVAAYVTGAPEAGLRWRLELTSRNPGGSSRVAQAGTVTPGSTAPVGSVLVSPDSRGTVVLRVYDGDREVASDEVSFGDQAGS